MNKKIVYRVIFVLILVLGYLNYFGKEKNPFSSQQVIETTNVFYESDDYKVEALKQRDFVKEKETEFEMAKAYVKDMELSGDSVRITKERDIILKNNIIGKSQDWTFKTDNAFYSKLRDEISSDTGVEATNEKTGVRIAGDKFLSNSKMTFVSLENNVILENDKVILKGDKGYYDDEKKIIILSGNVDVEGKNDKLTGKFNTLIYYINEKQLISEENFTVSYSNLTLGAENLLYNQEDESLEITKNVKLINKDYVFNVEKIRKEPNSKVIDIYGRIKGDNKINFVEADKGNYNLDTKVLVLEGNMKGHSTNQEEFSGDKLIYNTETKDLTLLSDTELMYKNKDGVLKGKDLYYNGATKNIELKTPYDFNGVEYDSKGSLFSYDEATKNIIVTNGYLKVKSKNQEFWGDRVEHNRETKSTKILKNGRIEDENYIFENDEVLYDGEKKIVNVVGKYKGTDKKNNLIFLGSDGVYNQNTGELTSKGAIEIKGETYTITGQELQYNSKTLLGKTEGKVVFVDVKDGLTVTGDEFSFKNKEYLLLEKNLKLENSEVVVTSDKGKYNLINRVLDIPNPAVFKMKTRNGNGKITDGKYFVENNLFSGNNFSGMLEGERAESRKIDYYVKEKMAVLEKDIYVENKESILRGNKANYYLEEQKIELLDKYQVEYDDIVFYGERGSYNKDTGLLEGDGAEAIRKNGDRFKADKISGNMGERIVDFIGNVTGKTTDEKGVVTDFYGEKVRNYFKKDGKFVLLRSEITGNAKFIQEDKILTSTFIELDNQKKKIFSKENSKMTISNKKDGDIKVVADFSHIDLNEKIVNLTRNVKIDRIDTNGEKIQLTGDNGRIYQKENILEMQGDVVLKKDDSKMRADKMVYDTKTKKVKASGNVFLDYQGEKRSKL